MVFLVVPGDHPHHAQGVHHRWQGIEDLHKCAVGNVFEVALEGGEELDVVLRLDVALLELGKLAVGKEW